jgi:hypothetical protein
MQRTCTPLRNLRRVTDIVHTCADSVLGPPRSADGDLDATAEVLL